jgi:hypothetical protein
LAWEEYWQANPEGYRYSRAYRDLIEQALDRGRNGKAIWQDLVSEHGTSRARTVP